MTTSSAVFGIPSSPAVMTCAKPAALGMSLPCWSVRSSGTAPVLVGQEDAKHFGLFMTSPVMAMRAQRTALDQLAGCVGNSVASSAY